jgi:hypothetical protein
MIPQTKTINLALKLSKIYIAEYLALIGHSLNITRNVKEK